MELAKAIEALADRIGRRVNLMEVCGTHTVSIFRHGIRSILPESVNLLSGPGCPVCVTSGSDVAFAVSLALRDDVILATFGDMMRVPGGGKSLMDARSEGGSVRIVYSPLDCISMADENRSRSVVFFSAGFETTVPAVAATIHEAERRNSPNFLVFSVHKLVPPALELLLRADDLNIDGFILPGHVSTVIGSNPYRFIAEQHGVPCVIAGFGAEDILLSVFMLLRQISKKSASVEIQYRRAVREEGNPKALSFMERFFEPCDAEWRGIGTIPLSGLKLREEWKRFNAGAAFPERIPDTPEPKGCRCGLVLRGIIRPDQCPLFATACTPEKPVGACMVSSEGSCAAYFKYGNRR